MIDEITKAMSQRDRGKSTFTGRTVHTLCNETELSQPFRTGASHRGSTRRREKRQLTLGQPLEDEERPIPETKDFNVEEAASHSGGFGIYFSKDGSQENLKCPYLKKLPEVDDQK